MGARPSGFKKSGGGFLNGVDGVITGYQWTDEFNGVAFKPGKDPVSKKDKFHSLYFFLSVRVDGATEDVTTTLFVGGADDFEITNDGHTLVPVEDGRELGGGSAFAKLIVSLIEAGFPEASLSDSEINYEPIIGARCRFIQRVNEEDTKKLGKRKDKKTGKEYARTDLIVDQVYEVGSAPAPAAPTKAAKPVKGAKPAAAPTTDTKTLAVETLMNVLAANEGQITVAKLGGKVLIALMKHPERDAARSWLLNETNLQELADEGIVTFNTTKKIIALA